MTARRLAAGSAVALAFAALLPTDSAAVPVFARKYGFQCTMCHSSFPRLNDFGARYRANGYRLPGRENIEKTIVESPTPLALRTSGGWVFDELSDVPGAEKTNELQWTGLDVLSAGQLGAKIGYFLVFVPGISGARGVAEQEASLEMASIVFSDLGRKPLSLRAGRFEPAYAAFSVKRALAVSPYEVYEYSFAGGPAFSATQTGLEVRVGKYGPVRALAGLVAGSETNRSADGPQDGYARVEAVLGPGEGQTAGQRVGVTGYVGRARPDATVGATTSLETFARVGVDASLNAGLANLALQYLWAREDGALWGRTDDPTWWGGFAELTFTSAAHVTGFVRGELVKEPSFVDQDIRRFTVGGRYHFEDNVAAHLEYSHRVVATSSSDDPAEDFFAGKLDVAF